VDHVRVQGRKGKKSGREDPPSEVVDAGRPGRAPAIVGGLDGESSSPPGAGIERSLQGRSHKFLVYVAKVPFKTLLPFDGKRELSWLLPKVTAHSQPVTPAKAGVQNRLNRLDSGLRRNDSTRLLEPETTFGNGYSLLGLGFMLAMQGTDGLAQACISP